jgi:hypothetical protein
MTKSGWRNESYRHYLAAKGIATKYKYYSKFGDFLRTAGTELQVGQERYYREEPAKEAARLRMQQAVIAKERETPLSAEYDKEGHLIGGEQFEMQKGLERAGKTYTEARLRERFSTLGDQYDRFAKKREEKTLQINKELADLPNIKLQIDEKYDTMVSEAKKHGKDTDAFRHEVNVAHLAAKHNVERREKQLEHELYAYGHNQDIEYKTLEKIKNQMNLTARSVKRGSVVNDGKISAEVKTNE